ncbi:hypothetical protein K470DRAFT_219488 [Piedraia hortae CBS 480.64]|uniref:Uncharacterized protein n=1 Tax=Piedraia hortae CBS 480.64 TaxID=1314780 RepID=A0A6A7BVP9_9PEZI|nr:hypothetical protein K470DRAFT_219488 [Piedraia hortae CBS 480.64]
MFGLIVAGRPVDATPQIISPTQQAFTISSNPPFRHIVVFLLPGAQLPAGAAATIYIRIPPSTEFKPLGSLGPGKESAMFQISGLKTETGSAVDLDAMTDDNSTAVDGEDIVVGVSVEPIAQVEAQMQGLRPGGDGGKSAAVTPKASNDVKALAQKIIGNAFDFLASYGSDTVPLKAFQSWWNKFEHKLDVDPGFLERAK